MNALTHDLLSGLTITPEFAAALANTDFARMHNVTAIELQEMHAKDHPNYQLLREDIENVASEAELEAIFVAAGTTSKEQKESFDAAWAATLGLATA